MSETLLEEPPTVGRRHLTDDLKQKLERLILMNIGDPLDFQKTLSTLRQDKNQPLIYLQEEVDHARCEKIFGISSEQYSKEILQNPPGNILHEKIQGLTQILHEDLSIKVVIVLDSSTYARLRSKSSYL